MIRVNFENDRIFVSFKFSWDIVEKVKSLGIMQWDKTKKLWHCEDNRINRDIIGKAFPETGIAQVHSDITIEQISDFLMPHQKNGVEVGIRNKRWGFWYDTGTGKTLMALETIRQLKVKTLIVCPLALIRNAWIEDARKFFPDMRIINLWELNKKKAIRFDAQVNIINYESLIRIGEKYKLEKLGFQCVVLDESAKVKNPSTSTFKTLIKIIDNADFIFSLSAMPAPNSIQEYFTQMRMINPSKWGKSFYKWRLNNFRPDGYGGFKWFVQSPEIEKKLLADIAEVSSVVRKEDVLKDLPERTFNIRSLELSTAERTAFKKMAKNLFIEISNDQAITAANAAVKIGKLRQITSGFILDTESEQPINLGTSKLDALSELLEEIGSQQVLIWTQYQYEAVRLSCLLSEQGKTFGICNGTVSQSKQNQAIDDFKSGKIKYLIAHPASIGHGVTLVNCSYAVYFSRSYSYHEQYQSQDRIYRYGQKNACTYYFLDAENSIDGIIREVIEHKKKLNEVFIEAIKDL